MTLRAPSRPGGTTPRPRRRGRLSPTNGSVTRGDVEAIYAEFTRDTEGLGPLSAKEFKVYLVGAIIDPSPGPRTRAKLRRAARAREARRRAERESRETRDRRAQLPIRATAAA